MSTALHPAGSCSIVSSVVGELNVDTDDGPVPPPQPDAGPILLHPHQYVLHVSAPVTTVMVLIILGGS